jgi:hypothetical protein
MTKSASANSGLTTQLHPNEFDRKRIERALEARQRYRYVAPCVVAIEDGYRIESPCCSRNVDAEGGIIDVALIEYHAPLKTWHLYRKDHVQAEWILESSYGRLHEALDKLKEDPDRLFWQ